MDSVARGELAADMATLTAAHQSSGQDSSGGNVALLLFLLCWLVGSLMPGASAHRSTGSGMPCNRFVAALCRHIAVIARNFRCA